VYIQKPKDRTEALLDYAIRDDETRQDNLYALEELIEDLQWEFEHHRDEFIRQDFKITNIFSRLFENDRWKKSENILEL